MSLSLGSDAMLSLTNLFSRCDSTAKDRLTKARAPYSMAFCPDASFGLMGGVFNAFFALGVGPKVKTWPFGFFS